MLKFAEQVKDRGRQGSVATLAGQWGRAVFGAQGGHHDRTGPPPWSHVSLSRCPALTAPVGNPPPWLMLYQETVASPGQVPAAQAPPASGHQDRVGGAGTRRT